MRTIGFSTGAVALGDFRKALDILGGLNVNAVELSALRMQELQPLVDAIDTLDLNRYRHVAFHAPSRFSAADEESVVRTLQSVADRNWWIVVHPDSIQNRELWKPLESSLCFENMDRRKPGGRTAIELSDIFNYFPRAALCFDVGHAHQVDRTMTEARQILQRFGDRIKQMHVSEVNTASAHVGISVALKLAVEKIVDLIDDTTPLIIESVLPADRLANEIDVVERSFGRVVCAIGVPD